MIPRTLEPEWMDDPKEAADYDSMDHDAVNGQFVEDLIAGGEIGEDILDLGTGTAQIPVALCQRLPDIRVMALDAAASMLELAYYNIEMGNVTEQVQLMQGDAKTLEDLEDEMFDCVMSNSLVHHLPDPQPAFNEAYRLTNENGRIFIRDLMRPASEAEVESIVKQYTGEESKDAQQLFRQSLHAALTLEEAKAMAEQAGMSPEHLVATSDRHWTLDVRKAN